MGKLSALRPCDQEEELRKLQQQKEESLMLRDQVDDVDIDMGVAFD